MSWKATAKVKELTQMADGSNLTRSQKLVLMVLADYYNQEKGCAWVSHSRIGKESLTSTRHIQNLIRSLERGGLLRVERRAQDTNLYFFPFMDEETISLDKIYTREISEVPVRKQLVPQGREIASSYEPEVNKKEEQEVNPCLPIPKPEKQKKATKPFRPGRTLDDFPDTPVVSATAPDPPADVPPPPTERSNGNLETFWRDLIRVYKQEIGRPLRSMGMKTREKFVEICERYGTEKVEIGFSELLAENREYLRGHTAPKSPAGWIVFRLEDSIASAEVEPKEKNYDNWVDGEKYRGPNGKWWLNGMPLLTAKEE